MFTPAERSALRDALVALARSDGRIAAAALVGSAASGSEDEWSDIDLALRLDPDADATAVVQEWTDVLYARHAAVHHVDLWSGRTRYRAFLLRSTLQVDISFWPAPDFLPTEPAVDLLFGDLGEPEPPPAPSPEHLAGTGWLYALHVRSALARGRRWQAVHMLDGLRDQLVALACLRHGLPAHHGRGVDELPLALTAALVETRARDVDAGELHRAFVATITAFLDEVTAIAPELAARLAEPARALTLRS